jgi:uncharacterized coiled-coil protein SlyX
MIVASLVFLPACADGNEAEIETAPGVETEIEQEGEVLDPRLEALEDYTVEQRAQFESEVGALAQEYDTRIADLEAQAAAQTDETVRTQLNEQIAGLRQQRELIQQQLDQLGAVTDEQWDDLKLGIMTAIENFERSFEQVESSVG